MESLPPGRCRSSVLKAMVVFGPQPTRLKDRNTMPAIGKRSVGLLRYLSGDYLSEMTRSKGVSPFLSKAVNDVSLNFNGELFSGFEKLEGFKPRT